MEPSADAQAIIDQVNAAVASAIARAESELADLFGRLRWLDGARCTGRVTRRLGHDPCTSPVRRSRGDLVWNKRLYGKSDARRCGVDYLFSSARPRTLCMSYGAADSAMRMAIG